MFRKTVIFILTMIIFSITVSAQQVTYFDGKIINTFTGKPVPFSTVRLKTNQLGVYANADGDFKIANNPEFLTDSIIITCIGYRRKSVAVSELTDQKVNSISLSPSIYGLGEVTVFATRKKLSSVPIIVRAIRNIKRNYPVKPFSYIAYYRDFQKENKQYFNMNEGIVQALDNGFTTESIYNNYRLLDFRKNTDFETMDISPYYEQGANVDPASPDKVIPDARLGDQFGNELFVLMVHDAIRNYSVRSFSFIEMFSRNFVSNHEFSEPVTVYNNNMGLLKIDFKGRKRITGDSLMVKGSIYIQPGNYAIHKLEYACYYLNRGRMNDEMFSIDTEYGYSDSVDSLMCLKYISFNNTFDIIDRYDNSYFRILKSYWDTQTFSKPTLVLELNHDADPVSARKKSNYYVKIGGREAAIKSASAGGRKVYLRFDDASVRKAKDSCVILIRNLKDSEGYIVGVKKRKELYQFRELFVQEYNKPVSFTDSCYIKFEPLDHNCLSRSAISGRYWMNTPENIKNK